MTPVDGMSTFLVGVCNEGRKEQSISLFAFKTHFHEVF